MPTYNRPELVKPAVLSVLNQTYKDLELIIIDDGLEKRADQVIKSIDDHRLKYLQNERNLGGGASRNRGIKEAVGSFIAFLDDDDIWLDDKLEKQLSSFEKTSQDVGFSFTSVKNIYSDHKEITTVPEGIDNYYELALRRFKGFLTVTLMVKSFVFKEVGLFDDSFASHQEADLVIRIAKKYKGLGINLPLTEVNMKPHEQIGSNLDKRLKGREAILKKHFSEYQKRPSLLALQYFRLALMNRQSGRFKKAKNLFLKAFVLKFNLRYLYHYLRLILKKDL